MKNAVLLFFFSCLFFGCKKQNETHLKIKEAEELILSEKPDSAKRLHSFIPEQRN